MRPHRRSATGRRRGLAVHAFETCVDVREGQGPIYDAGFVESHAPARRERDRMGDGG
jgi:hypothetical protein